MVTSGASSLQRFTNFVGGRAVEPRSDRVAEIVDPSTGEPYATAPVSGPGDVDEAMRAAGDAFPAWRDATPSQRALALLRIADSLEEHAAELARIEGRDTGKPLALTLSEEVLPPPIRSASSPARRACSRAALPRSTWQATPPT